MKNTIFPLLFSLLFLISCCGDGNSVPAIKFGGLNGNVSMTKDSQYEAVEKFGEPVPTNLFSVSITEYDNEGHQVKSCIYDKEGDYVFRTENVFEDGLVVSESQELYFNKGKDIRTVVERKKNYIKWQGHTYDGSESILEYFYKGLHLTIKDGDVVTVEMDYDKAGHVLEQKNYLDGKVSFRILREFDNNGNMSKMIQYSGNDEPQTTLYQYKDFDKKGNWTSQYIYEDGKLAGIIIREITYR